MDLTALYTAIAGVVMAGFGILVRQLFVWLSSKNIFKNEALKQKLLQMIDDMAVKGIAVANQEFVDRLRSQYRWRTMDEDLYKENCTKALEIAKKSVIELLTVSERKLIAKLFGGNETVGVIESVILERLRTSKQKETNLE